MSATCKECGTPITWRMFDSTGREHACKREARQAEKTAERGVQPPLIVTASVKPPKACKYCGEWIRFEREGDKWYPVDSNTGAPHLCKSGMPEREPVKAGSA